MIGESANELSLANHDQKSDESNSLRNLEHVYVLAQSRHYGHELSFQKYANSTGWQSALHFSNGGISVDLLRMDGKRKSKAK